MGLVRLHGAMVSVLACFALLSGCVSDGSSPVNATPEQPRATGETTSGRQQPTTYRAFASFEDIGAVAVLSGPHWRLTGKIRVASDPHNVDANGTNGYVAVTSPPADTVTIIRATDPQDLNAVRVGAGRALHPGRQDLAPGSHQRQPS